MPAYVIADVEIRDPDAYAEYTKLVPATLEPFGGRFVVRGPQVERLEGDWQPHRLVVLEFPDLERARAWYGSARYEEAKAIRQRASHGSLLLVDGYRA